MLFMKADKTKYLLVSIKEDVGYDIFDLDRNQSCIFVLAGSFVFLYKDGIERRKNHRNASPWRGEALWESIRNNSSQRRQIKQRENRNGLTES